MRGRGIYTPGYVLGVPCGATSQLELRVNPWTPLGLCCIWRCDIHPQENDVNISSPTTLGADGVLLENVLEGPGLVYRGPPTLSPTMACDLPGNYWKVAENPG